MIENNQRFVIRVQYNRRLHRIKDRTDLPKLYETLAHAPLMLEREVVLAARRRKSRDGTFPARTSRTTMLEVRARPIQIATRVATFCHLPDTLDLHFVEVREPHPPAGCEPVVWRLVTTEPIETAAELAAIVDAYRMRWGIEEFFKALKTGCNYESLQLESSHGLLVTLAIYSAVAWRLLHLRWLAHKAPATPADTVFPPMQLAALRAAALERNRPLPAEPTVVDTMWAIAGLGGHLKRNGAPGWLTLSRGFERLLIFEAGWQAAHHSVGVVINH